jgi:hypothetical protein
MLPEPCEDEDPPWEDGCEELPVDELPDAPVALLPPSVELLPELIPD